MPIHPGIGVSTTSANRSGETKPSSCARPLIRYSSASSSSTEAGSAWLSMEWKMAVGEVLLNRVASPEFPDTLAGCAFQPGQYTAADEVSKDIAKRLINLEEQLAIDIREFL